VKITNGSNTQDQSPTRQLAYGLQPIRFIVRTDVQDSALVPLSEWCSMILGWDVHHNVVSCFVILLL